ncbi:hypothetical protein AB7828_04560 [Tardiphaga sp. 215_C5_N2_1]|uniref:hypothetical protein n=1 Tax=Tardiphaga TaxID=1395974 RepID=UPI001586E8BA|nr:hypothetical protein [Tardiphaga robiniae]NUU41681.1 hypothetical protein [Tardiphaga robiniae]
MKTTITTAAASALIALIMSGAATASERRSAHRYAQPQAVTTYGASRDAFAYYPGWGRDPVLIRGVYPGLVYGGATSAPAGR